MRDSASEVYGLGERAMARKSDPDTSHDAAASISEEALTDSQLIVQWILSNYGPMTDEQIAWWYKDREFAKSVSPSGLRSRRSELVRWGLVERCGTGKTASGRDCAIWKVI